MKDRITLDGVKFDVRDIMNPKGVFLNGERLRELSAKDMLPLSGKLIPEFDRRQSIRDMFTRKPILSAEQSQSASDFITEKEQTNPIVVQSPTSPLTATSVTARGLLVSPPRQNDVPPSPETVVSPGTGVSTSVLSTGNKRPLAEKLTKRSFKRVKSATSASPTSGPKKGQQSLVGFFLKPKTLAPDEIISTPEVDLPSTLDPQPTLLPAVEITERYKSNDNCHKEMISLASSIPPTPTHEKQNQSEPIASQSTETSSFSTSKSSASDQPDVHDPIESKESWSKLFAKPVAPRCEGHEESCTRMLTKKSGMNCGRSFWMCARPLGPTGMKERNTQWRCQTFIWCSDWNPGSG